MQLTSSKPVMVSRYLRPIAIVAMLQVSSQCGPAYAQGQAMREMHHAMWTARDGAPQVVTELAQHPDGTLWIGSQGGLFHFDGQTFRPFQSPPGQPELPSGEVYSLLITKDGTVWAGFYPAGVARIAANRVTVFRHVETESLVTVQQLQEAPDGSIWAIDGQWRLVRFGTDGMWRFQATPSSAPVAGIFVDSANILWLAQEGFLHRRVLTQAAYTRTDVPADAVTGFAETPAGDIWMNDYDAIASLGRTQQISRQGVRVRILHSSPFIPGAIVSSPDGSVIVTSSAGVRRFRPEETALQANRRANAEPDVFARDHGLSSNATRAAIVDSHGNIWIGGLRGLDRLKPARMTRYVPTVDASGWAVCASNRGELWVANTRSELYSASGQLPASLPGFGAPLFSLACADGGHAWFVNNAGVWAVASGKLAALPPITGARRGQYTKILAASDGTLFATVAGAFDDGGGIWQYRGGRWAKLPPVGELGAGGYAAYIDRRDGLWIGSTNGRAILHTAAGAQAVSSGEPGLGYVHAFLDTSRGLLAAGANGLAVWRDSRLEMLTFADPSLARGVRGLVEDRDGDLWLNSAIGFVHVPANELEAGLARPTYPLNAKLIREGDFAGAGAPQGLITYLDTAARDSKGRLWFATRNGVVHLDPEGSTANHPPIVSIRSIIADGQPIGHDRLVAPGTRSLEIQYFGVHLTAPENVVYRYRLEGFDDSWQESGRRTEAFYTRLPPGSYTFSVRASNGDGVWTTAISSPPFTVLPRFFQTRWFAAGIVGLAGLIIVIAHLIRVRQIARAMRARFDERLDERTRVARELHDTLLQTVHGSKLVADRALRDTADRDRLVQALEQLSVWLGQAATEGRAALQSLRASTTQSNDLAGAFRRAIDECRNNSRAETPFSVLGRARELHPAVRDEVYRIGYEAIRNACVHARASRIEVTLEYGHDLTLRISDDGVGIDAAIVETGKEGHFGLRGMRERAERIGAAFTLVSSLEMGTAIALIVPGRVAFLKATREFG
jgi:signal transduction histidine kinase/ligand-binding sensor domain-containing protein